MQKHDVLYIYDLTPKNKQDLGKIKRRFYYHLNKYNIFIKRTTKSAIIVKKEYEKPIDNLFHHFSENIIVYKFKVIGMEIFK